MQLKSTDYSAACPNRFCKGRWLLAVLRQKRSRPSAMPPDCRDRAGATSTGSALALGLCALMRRLLSSAPFECAWQSTDMARQRDRRMTAVGKTLFSVLFRFRAYFLKNIFSILFFFARHAPAFINQPKSKICKYVMLAKKSSLK